MKGTTHTHTHTHTHTQREKTIKGNRNKDSPVDLFLPFLSIKKKNVIANDTDFCMRACVRACMCVCVCMP